jgi:CubicO group peptidase (beta-lactamase class C family)
VSIAEHRIGGWVADGFRAVSMEFERNFRERGELGAAFAVELDGEPVVDLWGGIADRRSGRRWTADTLQLIFSGSKGLVACCLLLLIDRGLLELDRRVSEYWPEFGAAAKDEITVAELVSHQARLPGLEQPVSWREATDARRMAELVAAQGPSADPRATLAYHAITFGWLCGELVRRIDGRTIGKFFSDEIALPLDLELWIGLPESLEPRVATLELSERWGEAPNFAPDALAGDALLRSTFANPERFNRTHDVFNEPAWHRAEVPATNAIGTARAVAHLYGHLSELISEDAIRLGRTALADGEETLLARPFSVGVGFQLQTAERRLGPPDDSFGHGGSGGSLHGCWPSAGVSFSYAMNLLRDDVDDIRGSSLLQAVFASLDSRRAQ